MFYPYPALGLFSSLLSPCVYLVDGWMDGLSIIGVILDVCLSSALLAARTGRRRQVSM